MSQHVYHIIAVVAIASLVLQIVEISPINGMMSPVCKTVQKAVPALSSTWQWNQLDMLGSSNFLLLQLNAVSDFGLGLGPYDNNHAVDLFYKVLFGGSSNSLGNIKRGTGPSVSYSGYILNSNCYLYVYWANGIVQAGTGWHIGRNVLMTYIDPLPPLVINYLGFTSYGFSATANVTICPSVPLFDEMLPTNAPNYTVTVPTHLSCGQVCFSNANCTGFALVRNVHPLAGNISCSIYYTLNGWQFDATHATYLVNNYTYFMN